MERKDANGLLIDADGCHTIADGSCISSGPCIHTAPNEEDRMTDEEKVLRRRLAKARGAYVEALVDYADGVSTPWDDDKYDDLCAIAEDAIKGTEPSLVTALRAALTSR